LNILILSIAVSSFVVLLLSARLDLPFSIGFTTLQPEQMAANDKVGPNPALRRLFAAAGEGRHEEVVEILKAEGVNPNTVTQSRASTDDGEDDLVDNDSFTL
jgi:hypothetical protein